MKQHPMFELVGGELLAVEQEIASAVRSHVDMVTDIGVHLFRAGGKRLRPALYLLCAKSGKPDPRRILPVAAAIELIHMATLVHDDVIDESATRRGFPTANSRWGNQISVLAGDYLFAKAFSLIARNSGEMMSILTNAICAMCEGEIVQIRDSFRAEQSEADYLSRIAQKTAEFIAASCEMGAVSAGYGREDVQLLRSYGYSLGMAFQITDDILDFTASAEQIGKPAGNDLSQGVLTLPVIYALDKSPHRDELRTLIQSKDMAGGALKRSLDIISATDALEYSRRRASDYLEAARSSMPAGLSGEVRKTLGEIADFVGFRKY